MNIIRACLAGAALAAAAVVVACSDSHPTTQSEKGGRFEAGKAPARSVGEMAMCADSTMQLMPDGCIGRGGMLGSGTF